MDVEQERDPPMTPQPSPEDDPSVTTDMFRAFVAGDRARVPGGTGPRTPDRNRGRGTASSATRFRALSLLVGLAVFLGLAGLLLRA